MKRWPLNTAYFWEKAPFFRVLAPFVAGIICYDLSWLRSIPVEGIFFTISFSFVLFVITFYISKGKDIIRILSFSLLHILLFFCAYAMSYFTDIRNDKKWFGHNLQSTCLARITDIPIEKERSWKVPVKIINTNQENKISMASGDAFLYLYKDNYPMLLHKGGSLFIPAHWQHIKNAGNPFEFDYATYCRRNNLFYQQSCLSKEVRLYATNDPDHVPLLERAHDWCMQQLDKFITEPKTKGLLQAMLLGDEVNLDEDLRQSYSDTGIIHIIAISGGNVAIFFIVISALLWWLSNKKHFWIKYAIALPLVWFYMLMAGAQPSAIRAAVMFSLLALGIMLQKNNNSLNQLFATAFVLLCAQPMWLFSVGFQLSFVAVLSLILFYKPVYKLVSPVNKIFQNIWGAVAASIAAEILVAPLVIYYFHNFPLLFIVANVLAYIFMSLVLILSIIIIALFWLPDLAKLIGEVTVWIVTTFDTFISRLQNFNPISFHFITLSNIELILVWAIITCFALFFLNRQKRSLFTGLSIACILLCCFCHDQWARLHQQHFIVYNTGKTNLAEIINGTTYSLLNTGDEKKTDYVLKQANTYWQVWKTDTSLNNEIFEIKNKKILMLNADINSDKGFPIDYLVVNYTGTVDMVKLQRIFSPSLIIIGNNYSRKEQEKLAKTGLNNHIPVHITADNGAFIH